MTVVVGYIPNPQGEAALQRATTEAQRDGGRLVVVNASRSDPTEGDVHIASSGRLDQIGRALKDAGVDYEIRQSLRGGSPADEIVEIAAEEHASLIVIGLRHRSKVGKMIFGSTAQTILLDAECPVLAVKAARP